MAPGTKRKIKIVMGFIADQLYKARVVLAYRDVLRTHIPFLFKRMMASSQKRFVEAMKRLKGKEKIEVAFFLTIPGMWKADYLFTLMSGNPRFHPYVVILPYSTFKDFNREEVWKSIRATEKFIGDKGFEYIIPYDGKSGKWLDIKETLEPDIVFYSSPYKDNPPQYYLYNYMDKGTFYIPYAYTSMCCYKANYGLVFPNLVGCYLAETELHVGLAKKHGRSDARNYNVVGYPATDIYLRDDYDSPDVWRPQATRKKRVIWAPHHSLDEEGGLQVSTFLVYCDDMLRIAEKYKDEVQFAFKPHQRLKFKLELIWGKEKTYGYYKRWAELENCQLEEAGYTDLFIHSDAMIHDCGSFTTEYLFLNKPVMYLVSEEKYTRTQFNEFGINSFEQHYHGHNVSEIEQFIENVVIDGNDTMKESRTRFFKTYLAPKDGVLASRKVINLIENLIEES